ncbi:MAG: ABC transporter substrate-binding protein [Chloroflexota bacterium]|nr:ABC transporter substrate-binding protein [Chloroflexota bacterium]MDE2896211.1 ABC transporter substrate-binding protein [Chloroflexota bacterium]
MPSEPLKLGFLIDFSGPLAEYGEELLTGFELAIKHINEAGGVWGMPVETAVGDTALDPTIAVEEARRLIEVEHVHGLVGPMSSAMTLAVAESVSGPAQIPTISPVATSSQITLADDDDFLFRVSLADHVEGRFLARLAEEQGYDNVGLIYRDDAFGQGMATAFEQHWPGTVKLIGVDPRSPSFIAELEQSIEFGPQALVLISFPSETILILREALELGYYDQFVFGAPARAPGVSEAIGPELLAGMRGTYVAPAPSSPSSEAWNRAYFDEHGAPPALAYVKEAYDATIALALAAEAAGSSHGPAIRDQLRRIGSSPGLVVIPDPDSLSQGLQAARSGDDLDYQGAAGILEWDERGDSTHGFIGIWEFTADGSIADVAVFEFVAQ